MCHPQIFSNSLGYFYPDSLQFGNIIMFRSDLEYFQFKYLPSSVDKRIRLLKAKTLKDLKTILIFSTFFWSNKDQLHLSHSNFHRRYISRNLFWSAVATIVCQLLLQLCNNTQSYKSLRVRIYEILLKVTAIDYIFIVVSFQHRPIGHSWNTHLWISPAFIVLFHVNYSWFIFSLYSLLC